MTSQRNGVYPPLFKQHSRDYLSFGGSFMGRASSAASRIFVVRDEYGKGRLNTSYFFGLLTSVAVHTAYRPYWARSTSSTFNDFGSTMGSDAGISVFHEFRPGIQHMMKAITPKFVTRIEDRLTRNPIPKGHAADGPSRF
jgi:hypothetical protein